MIRDTDFGWNDLKKEFKKLDKKPFVKTGILTGNANKMYEGGTQLVDVAVINEFGGTTDTGSVIPARPFMRTSFDKNTRKYDGMIKRGIDDIVSGKTRVKPFLDKLGIVSESDTKNTLVNGPWVPNSPVTIAMKKSSRPLINTGTLLRSIVSKTKMNGREQ